MTERPFTTALFLLRCMELGLRPSDLGGLSYGSVIDMLIEKANDAEEWDYVATQEDFDRF